MFVWIVQTVPAFSPSLLAAPNAGTGLHQNGNHALRSELTPPRRGKSRVEMMESDLSAASQLSYVIS